MKRLLLLMFLVTVVSSIMYGQTKEELEALQAAKKDTLARLQGEVGALQGQIDAFPGWKTGAFGTIGFNVANFSEWYSKGIPNSSAGNIGFTVNAFANLDRDKFFWRNSGNINLGWVKFDDKDIDTDDDSFQQATDVFSITSLYGYKVSDNFAVSALGEYRTTFLSNFNDPGYLDLGVGGTWTPLANLVVVIHPLNYNIVFSKEDAIFDSSLGAKIVADYTAQLPAGVSLKSNFTTFQSYKSGDLSNWTWTNSFGYSFWKGIGVGFE
ncbi:MAG: DUF3078 domain-containing protein, partial [Cyclobacteriaceae bacterium]